MRVYIDANGNRAFDIGEGVDDLLVLVSAQGYQVQTYTENGLARVQTDPAAIPENTPLEIQTPYLHWSTTVKAPASGVTASAELRLELPVFPAFLP